LFGKNVLELKARLLEKEAVLAKITQELESLNKFKVHWFCVSFSMYRTLSMMCTILVRLLNYC